MARFIRNKFVKEKLGAKFRNLHNSWGVINTNENFIALMVWSDQISEDGKYVTILKKTQKSKSNGFKERLKHIELMKNGITTYGVICIPKDINEHRRETKSADENNLLLFEGITEKNDLILAKIKRKVPLNSIKFKNNNSISDDIFDILNIKNKKKLLETSRKAEIEQRLGQGTFRVNLLNLWNNKCCVTGCDITSIIVASHIKPWRDSNTDERQDEYNGLPLLATLDALFDKGYITFNKNGNLIYSSQLNQKQIKLLKLDNLKLTKKPHIKTMQYLEYHRKNIFIA